MGYKDLVVGLDALPMLGPFPENPSHLKLTREVE